MGENMELNKKEIEEIQEKLLMVYRFISQNNTFNKFYCQGLDVNYCSCLLYTSLPSLILHLHWPLIHMESLL